jgi:hypothetical protein
MFLTCIFLNEDPSPEFGKVELPKLVKKQNRMYL